MNCPQCTKICPQVEEIETLFRKDKTPIHLNSLKLSKDGEIDYKQWKLQMKNGEPVEITFFARVISTENFTEYGCWDPTISYVKNQERTLQKNKENLKILIPKKIDNVYSAKLKLAIGQIPGDIAWNRVIEFLQTLDDMFDKAIEKENLPNNIKQNLLIKPTRPENRILNLIWYFFNVGRGEEQQKIEKDDDKKGWIKQELCKKRMDYIGKPLVLQYTGPKFDIDYNEIDRAKIEKGDHILVHCVIMPYMYNFEALTFGYHLVMNSVGRIHGTPIMHSPRRMDKIHTPKRRIRNEKSILKEDSE